MAKNYKKGVYTLPELGDIIFKKCPGRFKNAESAYAQVRTTARRLHIGDINGKARFRFITATDADRIIKAIMETPSKKRPQKAEQISLFDSNIKWLDWLDEYTPDIKKEEKTPEPAEEPETIPTPANWTWEQAAAVSAWWEASVKLAEVFNIGGGRDGGPNNNI